jgi:hypothetical protein
MKDVNNLVFAVVRVFIAFYMKYELFILHFDER